MKYSNIKIIGFDADDTLWDNEPYFRESEEKFCKLLAEFSSDKEIIKSLFKTEIDNLNIYGYGIKGFTLSMIETALTISNNTIPQVIINELIILGKEMLNKPVVLLNGVENTLKRLQEKYKLIIATKGDLLDQERKLNKSGLSKYFHHIEVMSNKEIVDYKKLIHHLDITPDEFLMVGNSLKSDIIPVINMGGYGMHIPYHTTWQHEEINEIDVLSSNRISKIENISKLLNILC
ncbi:MAG: HAD family hydrolase [Bacteroidales bacterium]|jgi:putative hydrolase of the HAD superfamily|nr:HAD family hydrolase [Bacteroidales bacterium]